MFIRNNQLCKVLVDPEFLRYAFTFPPKSVEKWPVSCHLTASHSCRTIWPLPAQATSRQISWKNGGGKKRYMNIYIYIYTFVHTHTLFDTAGSEQNSSNPNSSFAVCFGFKKLRLKLLRLFFWPGKNSLASTWSKRRKILIQKKKTSTGKGRKVSNLLQQ